MKLSVLFTLACVSFFNLRQASAQVEPSPTMVWEKKIGGSGFDAARDVIINPDGTVIVVGMSYSNDRDVTGHHGSTSTSDAWIVKLDSSGNVLWQKSLGGTQDDVLSTIIAAGDSTYLCTGFTYSNDGDVTGNHGGADVWAVKISRSGAVLWSTCYGGSGMDTASNATLLHDGSLAIIGNSNSTNGQVLSGLSTRSDYDAWVIKIANNSGALTWEKCIDDSRRNNTDPVYDDDGLCILETDDNRLLVLVRGSRLYAYGSYPDDLIVTRKHGKLYSVDEGNGAATYLSSINDADGGEDRYSMIKKDGAIYMTYCKLISYSYPFNCTSNLNYFSKIDAQGNILSTTPGYTNLCDNTSDNQEEYENAPLHGLAVLPGGDFKTAGRYPLETGLAAGAWEPIRSTYDYWFYPFFTAIKAFPTGTEVISAGHDVFDFWVVKQQALNSIRADVYLDRNNNNVRDNGEPTFTKAVLKSVKAGVVQSAYAAGDGPYVNYVGLGNYQTSLSILRPYYAASSAVTTSDFTTYRNVVNINYPVKIIPGSRDYLINVASYYLPRPGFDQQYQIFYRNNGTDTLINKTITLVKDPQLRFNSASPAATSISGDTLRWTISGLQPDSVGYINLYMTLNPIPQVQIGDTIRLKGYIDNVGDVLPLDNVSVLIQEVNGSYDPNDKSENHAGQMPLQDVLDSQYLTYTIRFQNTGTDTAFTVLVRDTLDSKLDLSSLEMISASHNYQLAVKNERYISWIFNNIHLLDSFHNEPQSHGYIIYRIKAKIPQIIGDAITNTASIYFDFNPAVVTNTTVTKIKGDPIQVLWLGTTSVAWENPLNWNGGKVPDANSAVTIPATAPNFPEISSNAVCYSVKVAPTARILVKTGMKLLIAGKTI